MNMNDTTQEFERLLNLHGARSQGRNGAVAQLSDDEFADLMSAAEGARTAYYKNPKLFGRLHVILTAAGGFQKATEVNDAVNKAKVMAALGTEPSTPMEMIDAWLDANGYKVGFSGMWTLNGTHTSDDDDYILRSLKSFANSTRVFKREEVENDFGIWRPDSKKRIMMETTASLKFDPTIDPDHTELRKFVDLMVGGSDDPEELETIRQTAMIAFATFLFRVKNHIRNKFFNSAHLMIILQGIQGDGKTTAIQEMLSPLGQMWSPSSLEAFRDKSMGYKFSELPVMLFEEMQGAAKTDIDSIKSTMTDDTKLMVEKYKAAGVRKVVTTFIGASNKDIRGLFKDHTGNRRFIQFTTNGKVSKAELKHFDWLKIWQSIDEDAIEPPMYASPEATAMIVAIQEGQRVKGDVESWLIEDQGIPYGISTKDKDLFDRFKAWAEMGGMSKANLNFLDKRKMTSELLELTRDPRFQVKHVNRSRYDWFTIQRPQDATATTGERAKLERTKAAYEAKEATVQALDDRDWQSVEHETNDLVKRDSALATIIRLRKDRESPIGG